MAKFDFAARLGVFGDFRVAVIDIRFGREDVIQPAHGGRATLKDICDPSQCDHGPDEHGEITVEGNERTERNLPVKELMAALPQHDQEGRADERLKRRHKHAPGADEADVSRNILAVGLVEAPDFRFFLGVGAHDTDAGKILLDARGERGEGGLDFFVEIVNGFAEEPDGDGYDRRGNQNPEREGRRERDHDYDGHDHCGDGIRAVHDAGTEDHTNGIEVIRGAGHQFAGAIADVEFGLEDQQSLEEVVANVEFDVAGDPDERPSRGERKEAFDGDADNHDEAVDAQGATAARRVIGNGAAECRRIQAKGYGSPARHQ